MLFSLGWQVAYERERKLTPKTDVPGPWRVTAVQRNCVMETNETTTIILKVIRALKMPQTCFRKEIYFHKSLFPQDGTNL